MVAPVLDGPIPYSQIELCGDPDLEHALREDGFEPAETTYRLLELPVASISDSRSMPHRHWDRGLIDAIQTGVQLPPVVVVRNRRGAGWGLLDGVNRLNALVSLGIETSRAYELLQDPRP